MRSGSDEALFRVNPIRFAGERGLAEARKLATTSEQVGQYSSQSILKRPTRVACRTRFPSKAKRSAWRNLKASQVRESLPPEAIRIATPVATSSTPTVFSILPNCFFTAFEARMKGPMAAPRYSLLRARRQAGLSTLGRMRGRWGRRRMSDRRRRRRRMNDRRRW